jgi:hypothetical protein
MHYITNAKQYYATPIHLKTAHGGYSGLYSHGESMLIDQLLDYFRQLFLRH